MTMHRISVHLVACFATIAVVPVAGAQQVDNVINISYAMMQQQEAPESFLDTHIALDLNGVPLKQALQAIASQAGVTVAFGDVVERVQRQVTLSAKSVVVRDALDQILQGTGITYRPLGNNLVFERSKTSARVQDGEIVGRVLSAKTKQPIAGATIQVSGLPRNITTGEDGRFRLSLSPGEHTITVRGIGFIRHSQKVIVEGEKTISIEVVLDPSASVLDEVVVTGTVIATERKAIATPITVITAADIERRGITRIDQLFRGEIPGLLAVDVGTQSFGVNQALGAMVTSKLYSRGASDISGGANPIKTYVDGVELVDPSFLGTIDPKSIERIEIITGPQAATIYGSGALGGVMQIFTKKGSGKDTPDLTLNLRYGMLENNLSPSRTPAHNDALLIAGGTGPAFSYAGNFSYGYTGQWQPKLFVRSYGAQVGVTHKREPFTVSANAALTNTTNGLSGAGGIGGGSLIEKTYRASGEWVPNFYGGYFDTQRISNSAGQILSLSLDYRPYPSWQHHFTVGRTQNQFDRVPQAPQWTSASDSLFKVQNEARQRTTISYNTTFVSPRMKLFGSTITFGGSGSQGSGIGINACKAQQASGSNYIGCQSGWDPGAYPTEEDKTYGGFGSWQIGVADRLFVTLGLRGEHNPRYGRDHTIDWTPTNGVAYTVDFGQATIKILASYGRATRAPQMSYRQEVTSLNISWTPSTYTSQLANPDLRPEYERGPQGGIELYWGNIGSFTLNRYKQKVTDLITWFPVDSIAATNNSTGATGYLVSNQYANLDDMEKQGLEGTAALNFGGLSIKGSYSWNDSRIVYVDPKYPYAYLYPPGGVFDNIPSHFGSISIGYARSGGSVNLVTNYVGSSSSDVFYDIRFADALALYKRLRTYVDRATRLGAMRLPPSVKADLAASQRINGLMTATLNVTNVTNRFTSDVGTLYPTLGRQTQLGISMRFPRR